MKITVWLVTWERATWITLAEAVALGALIVVQGSALAHLVGLPILAHLGYTALTSLPLGEIPGAPDGAKQLRRNQDLRSRVVGFLNEVRRVEAFAQQAEVGGRPRADLEKDLHWARQRMMTAANEVAKAAGRAGPAETLPGEVPQRS